MAHVVGPVNFCRPGPRIRSCAARECVPMLNFGTRALETGQMPLALRLGLCRGVKKLLSCRA